MPCHRQLELGRICIRVAVTAAQHVSQLRTGKALHRVKPVERRAWVTGQRRNRERIEEHVRISAELRIVLVGHPVEADETLEPVRAAATDHDVVAATRVVVIRRAAADNDVMAAARIGITKVQRRTVDVGIVSNQRRNAGSAFKPVVAEAANQREQHAIRCQEVIPQATEHLAFVLANIDEVVAGARDDQVKPRTRVDDVVAGISLDVVVAERVGDDVVVGTTIQDVVASSTLDAVIAAFTPHRVIANATDEDVIPLDATQHDVPATVVLQVVAVRPRRSGIVARHERRERSAAATFIGPRRIGIAGAEARVLQIAVNNQRPVRRREDVARQVLEVRVAHDHRGKRVALELGQEVLAREARQVIEAVADLQVLHLRLEYERKRRSQHAAERRRLLCKAADPEIDIVEATQGTTGKVTGSVQEVDRIHRRCDDATIAQHLILTHRDCHRRGALALEGCFVDDQVMRAIGRNEVDDRRRMLHVFGEVDPACIGRKLRIARQLIELLARIVEARHAGIATAGDVQRYQVKRQAHQVVA